MVVCALVCTCVRVMGRLVDSLWGPSVFVMVPIHPQHLICSLPYVLSISSNGWRETKRVRERRQCSSAYYVHSHLHLYSSQSALRLFYRFLFFFKAWHRRVSLSPSPFLSSSNSAKGGEQRREIMEAGTDH